MNIYFTFATNFSQTFIQISLLIISNFSFLNLYQPHSFNYKKILFVGGNIRF